MQSRRQIRKTNGQRPVTSLPGKDRSYLLEETNLKMGKYFYHKRRDFQAKGMVNAKILKQEGACTYFQSESDRIC